MHHQYIFPTALVLLVASASAAGAPRTDTDLNCVILPDEQVDLSSPVPGVIEELLVRRSDPVVRGQVLARLESSVEAATLELTSVRAATDTEIRLRRTERGYDEKHRDRLQALHSRQAVSSQRLEDAKRAASTAGLRVRLAEERQREAILERRRADALIALKTIRSPINGVVVQRHKNVGEYVEDHPIVRIARLDLLRVELIAPLALFGRIHEGMQVSVRPETDPERARLATVTTVDAVADPGSGMFGVQLELPNPRMELPAGIKCRARLLPRISDRRAHDAARAATASTDPASPTLATSGG